MKSLVVALLVGAFLVAPVHAETWERYTNEGMNFSVSLPTSTFADGQDAGGQLSLESVDGTAQLDVFGVTNPEALTVAQFRKMMEGADPNRRITYRVAGKSWFVLSGYLDGEADQTVFYAKFMLNRAGTALSAFEISYPAARKREFDPLVERIEDSLTAPR